jgi:hypothetical protein
LSIYSFLKSYAHVHDEPLKVQVLTFALSDWHYPETSTESHFGIRCSKATLSYL